MTPPEQHCKHECVCWAYRENKIPARKDPCPRNSGGAWASCTEDTRRSRSAPAAPAFVFGWSPRRKYNDLLFYLKQDGFNAELFTLTDTKVNRSLMDALLHQPPASPDNADMLLNNLLAKFMLANKRGNFRPWNIQHIQQEIEYFREELRQSQQHPNGKQDVNCHACLEGLCQPCNHPVEGCPYYEPKQDGV